MNVLDGGPRTRVTVSFSGREAIPMERVRRPDPFVAQIYARNADTKKPWVKAEPSSHIWVARLPTDLGPGAPRAGVMVVDEYGREVRDAIVIEMVGR